MLSGAHSGGCQAAGCQTVPVAALPGRLGRVGTVGLSRKLSGKPPLRLLSRCWAVLAAAAGSGRPARGTAAVQRHRQNVPVALALPQCSHNQARVTHWQARGIPPWPGKARCCAVNSPDAVLSLRMIKILILFKSASDSDS